MPVKKQWYEIVSPKMFGEKVVGETLTMDPKHLTGRKISISLSDLTGDYSKFYVRLNFQIEKIDDTKALTEFVGHDTMRERIYRIVQRRGRRVDVIQDIVTKDGVKVRVKTIFVLIRRVGTSMKSSARACAREIIEDTAKETDFEDFMKMIFSTQLQVKIKKACSKIYPTGSVEVHKTEVMKERKGIVEEKKKSVKPKKQKSEKADKLKKESKPKSEKKADKKADKEDKK